MGRQPGDVVVRRDLYRGRAWYAVAGIVVEDSDARSIVYAPPGSAMASSPARPPDLFHQMAAGTWEMRDGTRYNHTLGITPKGAAHSVGLFWTDDWQFLSWYVNLQEPERRSAVGFDTCDHALDVVIAPDLSQWWWKDEDHLEMALAAGVWTPMDAIRMRREAERVIRALELRLPPFSEEWPSWRPDPSWPVPSFPDGWADVPAGRLGMVVRRWDPCPMCNNAAGIESPTSGPCAVITEDELTFTFVNPAALGGMPGHVLVIPKRHVEFAFDLTADEEQAIMAAVMRAARAVRAVLDPDGVLLIQRNGGAADQDVNHVHFHVIPRAAGTPFPPDTLVPRIPYEERAALAARLRDA